MARWLVLVCMVASGAAFMPVAPVASKLTASRASTEALVMFGGSAKAAPKKAAPKKAVKKVAKKVAKKVPKKVVKSAGEPNILKKLFAMSLIGGAKGVDLPDEYSLL